MSQELDHMLEGRVDLAARDTARRPFTCYLARLSPGSRRTMAHALHFIAEEFSQGKCGAEAFPWEQLRYEHTQVMRSILAERYAPATANKMLSALRGILKECWRLGTMNVETLHRAADIEPVRGHRAPKGRALTKDEVNLMLWHTDTAKQRALIIFLLQTGLRRAEAAKLRWGDLSPQDRAVRVEGKGGKIRIVPVPETAWDGLDHYHSKESPAFGRVFNVSEGRIWQIIRQTCFDAGIQPAAPHDLRRTYATRLLEAGVDLPTVQRLMGHADPRTTAGYDRRGLDEARAAVDKVFSS